MAIDRESPCGGFLHSIPNRSRVRHAESKTNGEFVVEATVVNAEIDRAVEAALFGTVGMPGYINAVTGNFNMLP